MYSFSLRMICIIIEGHGGCIWLCATERHFSAHNCDKRLVLHCVVACLILHSMWGHFATWLCMDDDMYAVWFYLSQSSTYTIWDGHSEAYAWIGCTFRTLRSFLHYTLLLHLQKLKANRSGVWGFKTQLFQTVCIYIYINVYYIFFGFRVQCRNKKPLDYPGFALSKTSLRVLVVLGG